MQLLPLSILKLICHLGLADRSKGKFYEEPDGGLLAPPQPPKLPIVQHRTHGLMFGCLYDLAQLLYHVLARGQESVARAAVNKVAVLERYELDSDYKLLHDWVSDPMATVMIVSATRHAQA